MKHIPVILFTLISFFISCGKDKPEETPQCILDKIEQEKNNCLDIVYRYKYDNESVYYFISNCPDDFFLLYDKDCQMLCSPSGGFGGRGDGTCPDFLKKSTDKKLIWQK